MADNDYKSGKDALPGAKRRTVLKAALGAGAGLALPELVAVAAKPPAEMRPQPGDVVVFRFGDRKGEPVTPTDVPTDVNQLLQAITMDPVSKIVRDASRLNGFNLVRLDPAQFSEKTLPYTADGIVAYSSVCNHQGCDLTQWLTESTTFKCYCHYSQFDATDFGQPVYGPSKRKLALLPIKIEEGVLVAADRFVGRVGFK